MCVCIDIYIYMYMHTSLSPFLCPSVEGVSKKKDPSCGVPVIRILICWVPPAVLAPAISGYSPLRQNTMLRCSRQTQ